MSKRSWDLRQPLFLELTVDVMTEFLYGQSNHLIETLQRPVPPAVMEAFETCATGLRITWPVG